MGKHSREARAKIMAETIKKSKEAGTEWKDADFRAKRNTRLRTGGWVQQLMKERGEDR